MLWRNISWRVGLREVGDDHVVDLFSALFLSSKSSQFQMEAEAEKRMMHQVDVSTECEKGRLKHQLCAVSTLGASPVP